MTRMIKAGTAIVMAAGLAVSGMAQVAMQTTQDYADVTNPAKPRLVINGKPIFISGINIAWRDFAKDVGPDPITSPQLQWYRNQFEQISAAGGNAVRWWLHTDAQHSPLMNMSTGAVTGLSPATIPNMRAVLDLAYEYGIVVSMCLFSFDLLQNDGNKTDAQMERNYKFLTEPDNLTSYIDNALVPILEAIGDHPAVMCWEVFNEPEGMATGYGWATQKIDHSHIIRFTARIAGEVHRYTKKMASTGIHNFHNYVSLYTDAKLKAVDEDGWLDFYMAHHYPQYESKSQSPFYKTASSWGFDRPVLIGEFPAQSWGPDGYPHYYDNTPLDIKDAYEYAYLNGYLGAMSWSITERDKAKFGGLNTTIPALEYLAGKYDDIKIRDIEVDIPEGNLVMKLAFNALASGDDNEVLIKKDAAFNVGNSTNLTFDLYLDEANGASLQMYAVVQGGAPGWGWHDVQVNLNTIDKGKWVTVTLPLSTFSELTASTTPAAIFFKFVSSGSPFTGIVYIDNVKIDNTVFSDFDEPYSEWDSPKGDAGVTLVTRQSVGDGNDSVRYGARGRGASARMPVATVRGKTLNVTGIDNSPMSIRLIDVRGKTVARFTARATGDGRPYTFPLTKIPAGRYFVETRVGKKRVSNLPVVVK